MRVFLAIFALLLLTLSACVPGLAQDMELHRDLQSGRVVFITVPKPAASSLPQSPRAGKASAPKDPIQSASSFLEQHGPEFGAAGKGMDLTFVRADEDQLGMTHVSFRQRYYGIPVVGTGVSVHLSKDGEVASVSTGSADWIDAPTSPGITSKQAEKIAIDAMIKEFALKARPIVYENSLVVFPKSLIENSPDTTSYLAYEVKLRAEEFGRAAEDWIIGSMGNFVGKRPNDI